MIDLQERLQFKRLSIDDAPLLVPLLENSGYNGCEFAFSTLYMWRHFGRNTYALSGDTLFLASREPEITFSAPVGGDFCAGIERLRAYAHDRGIPLRLYGSPENLTDRLERYFPGQFDILPSEPDDDYLYNTADLTQLSGKKYHGKRGHIAAFSKRYDWQYEPLADNNLADVLAMAEEWYRSRGELTESLKAEQEGVDDVLHHREPLHVRGGLIRVGDRVVAFTFGAPVSPQEFDIQVEKALPDFAEAYTVINREFAAHALQDFAYINRENDVGLEGLRKAKLSYHPARLIKKYHCIER